MKIIRFFLPFFRLEFGFLGEVIGAGASLIGGALGGISQANAAQANYKRRKKAYDEMIARANQTQNAGENVFNSIVDTQNPYLNLIKQDLQNENNEVLNAGRNQLNAALSQQGVRGGQAATQLARGIGNMATSANRDLNQMMYDDTAYNRNLKAAYNQAKALAGVNAGLQLFQ